MTRNALVTGTGTDGIGRAIVRALAHDGANIALHHHHQPDAAASLAAEIAALGRTTTTIDADFATPEAARATLHAATTAIGPIDILVCTAAILLRKPALEITDADWTRVATINLHSTFAIAQEAARAMLPRGWGRIVIVSSVNQWTPNPGLAAYAASKAGLMQMARTLALELAPTGITVNLIAPGTIETDLNRTALADPAWRAAKLDLIPMRRIGRPEDVAAAARFLASDAANYITGTTITVDGGLELRP